LGQLVHGMGHEKISLIELREFRNYGIDESLSRIPSSDLVTEAININGING
jgi:hypothetical protein